MSAKIELRLRDDLTDADVVLFMARLAQAHEIVDLFSVPQRRTFTCSKCGEDFDSIETSEPPLCPACMTEGADYE